ncbi:MAG: hypothetical protein ACRDD8_05965 [Bacteroidales bacterium]
MIKHYFPSVNLRSIDDEEFASVSNEAVWLHNQFMQSRAIASLESNT